MTSNRIFVLSSQKHLGINLQAANTVFEKTPLPCHEAYSAGARSVLMRMRIRVVSVTPYGNIYLFHSHLVYCMHNVSFHKIMFLTDF